MPAWPGAVFERRMHLDLGGMAGDSTGRDGYRALNGDENMIRVGRCWLGLGYWIGLVGAGAIVAAAILMVPLGSIGDPQILLFPVAIGALVVVAYRISPEQRLKVLRLVSTAAGLCIGASIVTSLLLLFPAVRVPVFSPGIFGLDGGAAYEAALYETWWDIWGALAILFLGLRYLLRYVIRSGRQSAGIGTGQ
jgi:hypothetical protein